MSDEQNKEQEVAPRSKVFDEQAFMAYISEQVDLFKKHAELIGNPEALTITDMNRTLAEYSVVKSTLISLEAMARIEARRFKENFENWFSEKFIFVRNRENRADLSAQKWLGQKELERIIRIEFAFEFKGFKDLMDMAEMRESFIGRMLDAWSNHQFILNRLSKNVEVEVMLSNSRLSREFE